MNTETNINEIDMLLLRINEVRYDNPEKAIKLSLEALSLSKNINYDLGTAASKHMISSCYYTIGNYEEAISLTFDSLDFFVKENIYDLQWSSYNLLGNTFSELGDYERGMDFYNNAEEIAYLVDDGKKFYTNSSKEKAMVRTLNNIAENYKLLKAYDESLEYCNRAYDIDKNYDFQFSKGVTILSLGELYYLLHEYDKANTLSFRALEYFKKYNYTLGQPECYKLAALTYWKKNDFDKADEYFNITIDRIEAQSSPYNEIDVYINYYQYLKDRNDLKKSLVILHKAYDLSIKNNFVEKISETASILSIFYAEIKDFQTAFNYFNMHLENERINASYLNKHRINNLNISKKIKKIEIEKKEIINNNENLQRKSESLQMVVEKLSIISELGQKITSNLDLDSIIDILYSSIKDFMDLTYLSIGLYDKENSVVNYLDVIERGKKKKKKSTNVKNRSNFTSICIETEDFVIINDMNKEFLKYTDSETYKSVMEKDQYELQSLIFCPLKVNSNIIGVMSIQSEEKNSFTSYHVEMVKSLSSYAAIAINNAIKSKQLEMEIEKTHAVQFELKRLNEKLLFLSENDSMTKIPNRRKLDKYLYELWEKHVQEKKVLSLIIFDIDNFKQYNDNYGHIAGDNCIVTIANILSSVKDENYFPARYGGDEFVVVLPEYQLDRALDFGESLKQKVANANIPHKFSTVSDKVTLSIGITSLVPSTDLTINEFMNKADDALYLAKKRGKNQIASFIN
ncbi:diguanylate cyclase [Clostridium sp. YIM B02505]|uniref:Diguanylate cyclase n=1 Tax=Clostridium yunnanense TaxID=2800325 RepID=A0ABS1EIZ2_9CLOT|nr:diguanylate cyclase [Clostridium yunnanense]MBK1809328.1 diguanylate cyclase [Clostridium yunnanense]